MSFDPRPGDVVRIGRVDFAISAHPAVPTIAFGQEGRKSTVYQMRRQSDGRLFALKVFKQVYRDPKLIQITEFLEPYAKLPGLEVCQRAVFTTRSHNDLLRRHPDLEYTVLMPWIAGDTWFDIVGGRRAISRSTAHTLGGALLMVLLNLEQRGAAHCDLSGSNAIVDIASGRVSLVDVEDMYGPGLGVPSGRPMGTDGYQHRASRTGSTGQWSREGDRFSGCVLLAEILTWHNAEIRTRSYGEHYFSTAEIHEPASDRYRLMLTVLGQSAPSLESLFERAWLSSNLVACPSFSEWQAAFRLAIPPNPWQKLATWVGNRVTARRAPLATQLVEVVHQGTSGEQDPKLAGRAATWTPPVDAAAKTVPMLTAQPVPPVQAPYMVLATALTPALIIYLLDTSMSMNRTSGGVRKIEVAWTALQNGIMSMIHRSTRGTVVAPRYRIAIFGYNSRVHDLLGGIKPISELTHQLPNPILDYGAQTASAFAFVEQVLKAELPKLQHCPAPLVCHLTDGMYAGADPEPVVARIRKAAVQDGNVLVENIFVSRSILKQAIVNPQTWRGVGDEQQILEDRKYARKLLAMSSMIPDSYLANLREFGYQLQPGAHMLMPGDTPELLRLGFVMSGATPTTR